MKSPILTLLAWLALAAPAFAQTVPPTLQQAHIWCLHHLQPVPGRKFAPPAYQVGWEHCAAIAQAWRAPPERQRTIAAEAAARRAPNPEAAATEQQRQQMLRLAAPAGTTPAKGTRR